ncbi:efflux RND transporter permease subunit [Mangrovibacterium lignilyticum]|uniref:efflux RND transporter permease subunit n=1 Tax=Mangrovibacterium lignilyticum TaxID=2668052 RepID=UPI001EE58E88|nr:MMPL family transporter [Mangrovibacterium lignilyticum]
MAYQATKVEMSYEHSQLLPKKDSAYIDYEHFRDLFGEEGNLIVVGVEDPDFFKLSHFRKWQELNKDLKTIDGVENMISASSTFNLTKDTKERKFVTSPIFPDEVVSQDELDSLANSFHSLPFYKGLLYNPKTSAYVLGITVNKDKMHSKLREKLVLAIKERCDQFSEETGLQTHYSGLPYIRVIMSVRIKKEIYLFSALAMGLCILTLFFFFRSFKAVLFPVVIVLTGVIWAMGTMGLLGYKINLLTGMIPSLLIVIGIPNSIYMLNKYHYEFRSHGNKIKSLQRVIMKIGNATFLTNLTTASGFATFIVTNSEILREFGLVASLNIIGLFLLSILMIPSIFSFLDPPKERHIQHLDNKTIRRIIDKLVEVTYHHIKWVYASAFLVLLVGLYGITLIKSSGYMVDDIPESDVIYQDLKFFENQIDGVMPLEIIIDTKKPNGAMNLQTFKRVDKLEQRLSEYPELSSSLSLLNILKFAKQSFYNGKEKYYSIPSNQERNFILAYAKNSTGSEAQGIGALHSFIDSTQQITRISIRMKDVGTKRMEALYDDFKMEVDSIFPADSYKTTITGSSITFFRGTEYLVKNLFSSLALAIFLISAFMAIMFYSWRMVIMSLLPNILPLIFTAAIMGFTGIPIKASTILVFSIAFGISVDNTIHFLAKYRQELSVTGWDIQKSVRVALGETGVSMMYTFVVLFFGFGVYSISQFGGTAALGVLVSLTLLVAITSNLILLPSLLIGLERLTTTRSFREPLLTIYNEEEDIELDDLKIEEQSGSEEDNKQEK